MWYEEVEKGGIMTFLGPAGVSCLLVGMVSSCVRLA